MKYLIGFYFTFFTLSFALGQDRYVDPAGVCGGNLPCYNTIQLAIDAAAPGETIQVGSGVYNEALNIDKSLSLLSESGRSTTTIVGLDPSPTIPYPNGTVTIRSNTSDVQIGSIDHGFTIVGYDLTNPAQEAAAITLNGAGPINNVTIEGNEMVADGEACLLQNYNQICDNLIINNNIFSGKTFVGAEPAGCGFGMQFSLLNVPRQLVVLGGGSGVTNSTNYTFTNNEVVGIAGGSSSVIGCEVTGQGNTLVTIDVLGAIITGNSFNGTTARFGQSLRTRGDNTLIQGNCFNAASSLGGATSHVLIDDGALTGTSVPTITDLAETNVYFGGGFYSMTGEAITTFDFDGALAANEDCSVLNGLGACGLAGSTLCAAIDPIPTLSQWATLVLVFCLIIFGVMVIKQEVVVLT